MNIIDLSHFSTTREDIILAIKYENIQDLVDSTHYRFIIDKLMYTAISIRLNITFTVSFLTYYIYNLTEHHLKIIKILL
jgi:hypothetical protein